MISHDFGQTKNCLDFSDIVAMAKTKITIWKKNPKNYS